MSDLLTTLAGDAGAEFPMDALNAIADMRRELDRIEEVTVRRARNLGLSWQLIALALGVSKQAVHKKYGGDLPRRDRIQARKKHE